ncbi:androgen-dependent TFPI-regulating protein [Pelodytes ibericus]
MTAVALLVYHCFIFTWYFFLTYALFTVSSKEEPVGIFRYGGQWKYLTVLNVVLQTLFYAVCFVSDLLMPVRTIRLVKCIIFCRDFLFSVLAFPASTFVFLSFWGLYSYDRELVYPEGLDMIIPTWLNHAMHTLVFPLAILEIVTSPHRYLEKKSGLTFLGICSVSYLSWVAWIYLAEGQWVYPFLGLLSPLGFIIFLLGSQLLAASTYIIGDILNYAVWGKSYFNFFEFFSLSNHDSSALKIAHPHLHQLALLLHHTPILINQYKKSVVRHLLNVAKALIPLHSGEPPPPSMREWIQTVEHTCRMEQLNAHSVDQILTSLISVLLILT